MYRNAEIHLAIWDVLTKPHLQLHPQDVYAVLKLHLGRCSLWRRRLTQAIQMKMKNNINCSEVI